MAALVRRDDGPALLDELARGDSLFLVHQNADPDALASAFALARAFGGVVGESAGVAASARRLAEKVGIPVDPMPHPELHARVVVVDTSTRVQLGPLAANLDPRAAVLVDHHAYGDLAPAARLALVDDSRASCAEVAFELLRRAGRSVDRDVSFALATGIVADSQRFRFGDARAMRDFLALAEPFGIAVADCLSVLDDDEPGEDLPRRIATLKAASRTIVLSEAGLLFARSEVSAFEASAATGLVRLGADLAVVASEKGGRGRVSARASRALLCRGVRLGEVVNVVATAHGWNGGGHDGAAGMNGRPPAAPLARAVEEAVRARLGGE